MKQLLTILFVLMCLQLKAQVPTGFILDSTIARSSLYQTYTLVDLPLGYNFTGNKRYPLLLWLHGAGEDADFTTTNTPIKGNITKLSKITNVNGPCRLVTLGWNADAVNPKTGLRDTFIIMAPQHLNNWSYSYNELRYMIPDILSKYRVDTTRIYMMGLSAGGYGINSCMGSKDSAFINRIAGAVTYIAAGIGSTSGPGGSYTATQAEANLRYAAQYGARVWTIEGENDQYLTTGIRYHDSLNKLLPTPRMKFTVYAGIGHDSHSRFFDTLARPISNYYGNTGTCNSGCVFGGVPVQANNNGSTVRGSGVTGDSLNVYEWLLTNQRALPNTPMPAAVAGTDQTITLPTSSVTLNGTGSDPGSGVSFFSTTWEKIMGPTATIATPGSLTTNVTGLVRGSYIFKLTVTNTVGLSHTDVIRVQVNSSDPYNNPTATLTSASTQNTSNTSVTVSLSYTVTGSTLKSIEWKKLKVPGQATRKVTFLGSSTTEGANASPFDSSYRKRWMDFCTAHGLTGTVTSLALSGMSIFQAMPTGYVPTGVQDAPDTARNITKALSLNPDDIGIFYGSNDVDGLTTAEVLFAMRTIVAVAKAAGKGCFIFTMQPRPAFGDAAKLRLREVTDSILTDPELKLIAVNAMYPLTEDDGITPMYGDGDGIHQLNPGHRVLGNGLISQNIFSPYATSASVITSPSSATTTITGLTNGTHKFLGVVTDAKGQTAYVVTTVNVNAASNIPPVANAGNDQIVTLPVTTATLNGSASTDTDGTITNYSWSKLSGPAGGTIANPSSASTGISALQQGTYVYRLIVTDNNGATASDDISVVIQPDPNACSNQKYTATNVGYYFNTFNLLPGDTLILPPYNYSFISIDGRNGTAACPIVIMNQGGIANIKAPGIDPTDSTKFYGDQSNFHIRNSSYIKVVGVPVNGEYGIRVQPYGNDTLRNGAPAVKITGRSRNIDISGLFVTNAGIGYEIKEDGGCDPSYTYPNWVMDSIFIHDGKIRYTWNQGIYAGNTSPDNAVDSYDPRPVVCEGVTIYPRPLRLGNVHIYNMNIDSTGRAAIQLSAASVGMSHIYNNVVKHSGMGGDEGQGFGIVIGGYTRAKMYNNTVVNTYMYGMGSQAGSGTPQIEITSNTIDSSGYLNHWNLVGNTQQFIKISTRAITDWNVPYGVYSIFLTTRTNLDGETTSFNISNNTIGRKKTTEHIGFNGSLFTSANVICGNTSSIGGSVTAVYEGPVVTWNGCGVPRYLIRVSRGGRIKFGR